MKKSDRLKPLTAAVEIQGIRLVHLHANTQIRSTEEAAPISLSIKTSTRVTERRKDGAFFILGAIDTKLTPRGEGKDSVVTIQAEFEIQYKLPSEFEISDDELARFARTNGIYNMWPYGRELIHNTLARMNLPPVAIPLLRIGNTESTAGQTKRLQGKT